MPRRLSSRRRQRVPAWRRLLAWLLAVVAGLAVLLVAFVALFDWNRARPWINERASIALQRPFAIQGDLTLDWRRAGELAGWRAWIPMPEIHAANIRIGNPAWADADEFATIERADIGVRLLPLLARRVDVPYVHLTGTNASLLRTDEAHANWTFADESGEPRNWSLQLGELRMAKATLKLDDRITKADLAISIEPLAKAIPYAELVGSGEADTGKGGEAPAVRSDVQDYAYAWKVAGSYRGAPVQAKGKVGSVLTLREGKRPFPLEADAKLGGLRVVLTGTLDDPADLSGLDLRLRLAGGSLAQIYPYTGVTLPDTPPFSTAGHLTARLTPGDSSFRYEKFVGRIGDSDIAGSLVYTTGGDRPKLEGALRSEQLQFADLGPLVGADRGRQDSSTVPPAPQGRLLPAVEFRTDRWNAMDADVRFDGKRIVQDAKLPISNLSTRLRLENARLTLDPLGFGLAGGQVRGSLVLDARRKPLQGDVDLAARKLQLKQLFPGFKAMQASFGELNGDIDLKSHGQSVASLLAAADGGLRLLMNDGAISKQLMETAGLNVGNIIISRLFGDKEVRIDCAAANFGVEDGLMTSNLAVFDTDNAVIDIGGNVNFADERMNLDIRPHTKGLRIFSLRSPLYVQGTFADPDVGVRKAALIAKGGAAIALAAFAAPAAALIPLISPSHGEQDNRCETLLGQMRAGK